MAKPEGEKPAVENRGEPFDCCDEQYYDEDSPYCECDLEPIEEESFSMTCFCCGKEILP